MSPQAMADLASVFHTSWVTYRKYDLEKVLDTRSRQSYPCVIESDVSSLAISRNLKPETTKLLGGNHVVLSA
jgi:hypothetical protein